MENKKGWICPVCGRGMAPWVKSCDCVTQEVQPHSHPYVPPPVYGPTTPTTPVSPSVPWISTPIEWTSWWQRSNTKRSRMDMNYSNNTPTSPPVIIEVSPAPRGCSAMGQQDLLTSEPITLWRGYGIGLESTSIIYQIRPVQNGSSFTIKYA